MENKISTPKLVGQMIPTLARSISEHKSNTSVVPDLINMLFEKYPDGTIKYKHFIIPHTGEEVRHETLDDFLAAHIPHGLQCTREDLRKWADYVPDRIKEEVRSELAGELNQHGGDRVSEQGVNNTLKNQGMTRSTSGQNYIIARLKRDNPEMAQKVLSGELTAHQASIKAGIRKEYIQVQRNPIKIVEKLRKALTDDELQEVRMLLCEL